MRREGAQGLGLATGRAAGPGCCSGRGRVEPEGCGPRLRTLRRPGAGVVTGPAGRRRVFAPGLGGRRGRDQGITRRIARPPADDPLVLPAESAGGPPPPLPRITGARARRVPFPRVERRLEVPQPVGRAGERLCGPGVAFTQLSSAPARGGSGGGGGSSAQSGSSAGRGLAPKPASTSASAKRPP